MTVLPNIVFLGNSSKEALLDSLHWQEIRAQLHKSTDPDKALALVEQFTSPLVLLDFDNAKIDVLNFLDNLHGAIGQPQQPKIIGLTEKNPLKLVIESVKMGVNDVINIQQEPHKLQQQLCGLYPQQQARIQGDDLYQTQKGQFDFSEMIGESPEMQRVYKILSKIIRRKWVTVLISGETGTGKELIARTIHFNNFDQYQPFVEINCNALPENLLESELFGYEKGAFTDAKHLKKGLFELANNGTLFLDEIGDISQMVQAKLLKAIEEKKIRRLGGMQDIQVKTRIITATNRDLKTAMSDGNFRSDLYYRLNVIAIHLPPLRERGDDIILLANKFLNHFAAEYESPAQHFSPEALLFLRSYHWPGNVRELKHAVERMVLLGDDKTISREAMLETIDSETPLITSGHPQNGKIQVEIPESGMSLDEGEKVIIRGVLESTGWNKRKTCRILKISRPRLDRKIQKYGLK